MLAPVVGLMCIKEFYARWVAHSCTLSTWELEGEGSQGQLGLHGETLSQ